MNRYLRLGGWAVGAAAATAILTVALCAAEPAAPAKPLQKQFSAEQKRQLDKAEKLAAEGRRLFEARKYRDAIGPVREALRIRREVLGPRHPDTAASLNELAVYLTTAGEYAKALPLQQQALEIRRTVLGPDHRDTATSMNDLADLYTEMAELAKALPLRQRALEIRRKALGPEDPKTAESMNALGDLYRCLGDSAKALQLLQQALEIRRRTLGPDSPDTAESMSSLVELYLLTGEYDKALPLARRAVEIRRKALGLEHPQTAQSLDELGALYQCLGDYAKALPLMQQAWEARRKVLGPEHPATVESLTDLAEVYSEMGDCAKALPLYRQAVDIDRRALGPEHCTTVRTLRKLGELYRSMGEYAKARPLLEQALEIHRRTLGPDNADTINSLNALAVLDNSMGDYAAALPLLAQTVRSCGKTFGAEHVDTATALNNLGKVYAEMGEYAEALPLLQRAVKINQKTLGPEHPDTAISLNSLAELYGWMGDFATATPIQERSVEIHRKVLGPENPGTLTAVGNLAWLYEGQGEFSKALPLFQQTLEITRRVCGPEHPSTACSLNDLACLYNSMGEPAKALPLYRQALEIDRKRLGPDHPNTVRSLGNLAATHLSMGDVAAALPLLQQSIEVERRVLGPRHPDTVISLEGLAGCFCALGEYARAVEPARQYAAIDNRVLDDIAPSLPDAQAMNSIETRRRRLDELLSAAVRSGANLDAVYALLWQRRGLVLRIGAARRQTGLAGAASPEVARTFADYRAVRAELARLTMTPAGTDPQRARQIAQRLNACGERKERLETELARLMPALGRQLQSDRRLPDDLRGRLPSDAALVDFVEYHQIAPGAKKPGARASRTHSYAAFVLAPGQRTACIELGSAEAINSAIARWSQALAEDKSSPSAATLRQLVWEPIERQLPRETKTVYLCPEGNLTRLCWAALPGRSEAIASASDTRRVPDTLADGTRRAPAATERVLLEDYALALVPSGQFLLEQWTAPQPVRGERGTLLAVGDVTYDAHPAPSHPAPLLLAAAGLRSAVVGDRQLRWPALPATADELSDVLDACNGRDIDFVRLSQAEAATDRVVAELPKARFAHFATHGFFADKRFRSAFQLPEGAFEQRANPSEGQRCTVASRNPLVLSGLVLAGANLPRPRDEFGVPQGDGGILTAEAIAMLPLDKLELAVLSACETGLGDVAGGEGVFGLQRAFHVAGARNVVASLWKVDDKATATLMQLFYRNLWQSSHPATPLAALREAQLALFRHPEWIEHPELLGRTDGQRGPDLSHAAAPEPPRRPAASPAAGPQRLPPKYWAAFVLSGSGQ
jgi:tetratricopeptide (TPR) repeat protein/CHAT domain-containing protein